MESIIDYERDEARGVEREYDYDRPTRAEAERDFGICPDIMGRDIGYEPPRPDPVPYDPANDPF